MENIIVFLLQQLQQLVNELNIKLDMDILNSTITNNKIAAIKAYRAKYGMSSELRDAQLLIESQGGRVEWLHNPQVHVGLKEAKQLVELVQSIQCFTSNTRILTTLYPPEPAAQNHSYYYGRKCPCCHVHWDVKEIATEVYDANCDNPALYVVHDEVWGVQTHTLLIDSTCSDCRSDRGEIPF